MASDWRAISVEGSLPADTISVQWLTNDRLLVSYPVERELNSRFAVVPIVRSGNSATLGPLRDVRLRGDECPQPSAMVAADVVDSNTFMVARYCTTNNVRSAELVFADAESGAVTRRLVTPRAVWVSLSSPEPSGFIGFFGECARIKQLIANRDVPIDAVVRIGELEWNIADQSCDRAKTGDLSFPTVMPSGGAAFMASPRINPVFEDERATLLVWDGHSTTTTAWRNDLPNAGAPIVAHHSDTIALSWDGRTELLTGPDTHRTILHDKHFAAMAWSPDDRMLLFKNDNDKLLILTPK